MKKNKDKLNTILTIVVFSFMGIFIIYTFVKEKKDAELLSNSLEHLGILTKKNSGNSHAPSSGDFKYKIDKIEYSFNQSGTFDFMEVGDTVLIEYAVEDPSVARVVDKYYMKKYRHMKKR